MQAPPRRDDGLRDVPCHAALEGSACKRLSGTRLHQCSCQQPETQKASPQAPFPHTHIHSGLQRNAVLLHIQFSSDAPSVTNKDSSWYVLLLCSRAHRRNTLYAFGCASMETAKLPCLCTQQPGHSAKDVSPMHRRVMAVEHHVLCVTCSSFSVSFRGRDVLVWSWTSWNRP